MLLTVLYSYNVLRWKDTTGEYLSSLEQLKNTPKDSIDVVFVGSSHVYCDIYPCFLWEKYGISSFNMSVSGQDKDSSYYHLKKLLKTQSPKVVCVDMFGLTYDKHAVEGNLYRNMLALNTSPDSVRLVNDYFEDDKETRKGDFYFRWPIIHTRYRELQKYDFTEYIPNRFLRGEGIYFHVGEAYAAPAANDPFSPADLSKKTQTWLERLYELSQKEGFSLVFTSLPFYADFTYQPMIDAAVSFAGKHDIGFVDFNRNHDEVGLDYTTDFSDNGHTNAFGAKKISEYLADYLKDYYDLPDHRGEAGFSQWDEDLSFYKKALTVHELEEAGSVSEFVDIYNSKAAKEDYTLVLSLEYVNILDDAPEDFFASLEKLGMNYEEYVTGGKWICKNGNLSKIHENDASSPFVYELGPIDTLSVKFIADGSTENIMINTLDYSNVGCYIDLIIYDNSIEEVVLHKRY
ncbi:MAG: hypothetical protein ILP13_01290 [Lachnospiraceae bacterium]|nr:hypothetical protein [Lachnospiraceae bacterium]